MHRGVIGATITLAIAATMSVTAAQSLPRVPGAAPAAAVLGAEPTEFRTGIYRGRAVTYGIIDGKPVLEGDILLDHVEDSAPGQQAAGPRAIPNSVGNAYPQYFWPKNGLGVAQIPTSSPTALRT